MAALVKKKNKTFFNLKAYPNLLSNFKYLRLPLLRTNLFDSEKSCNSLKKPEIILFYNIIFNIKSFLKWINWYINQHFICFQTTRSEIDFLKIQFLLYKRIRFGLCFIFQFSISSLLSTEKPLYSFLVLIFFNSYKLIIESRLYTLMPYI